MEGYRSDAQPPDVWARQLDLRITTKIIEDDGEVPGWQSPECHIFNFREAVDQPQDVEGKAKRFLDCPNPTTVYVERQLLCSLETRTGTPEFEGARYEVGEYRISRHRRESIHLYIKSTSGIGFRLEPNRVVVDREGDGGYFVEDVKPSCCGEIVEFW